MVFITNWGCLQLINKNIDRNISEVIYRFAIWYKGQQTDELPEVGPSEQVKLLCTFYFEAVV